MYYIVVISAAEYKNIRLPRKMWLKFHMLWYIVAFVFVYKHLILFLIQHGSCPCIMSLCVRVGGNVTNKAVTMHGMNKVKKCINFLTCCNCSLWTDQISLQEFTYIRRPFLPSLASRSCSVSMNPFIESVMLSDRQTFYFWLWQGPFFFCGAATQRGSWPHS